MSQTAFPNTTQDQLSNWLHCSPIKKVSIMHVCENNAQTNPGLGSTIRLCDKFCVGLIAPPPKKKKKKKKKGITKKKNVNK